MFVILTTSSGLTVYSLSVYLHAFVAEGRFATQEVSLASGAFSASAGLVGVAVGSLLNRYDVRRVMTAGLALMSLALLSLPFVHGLPALYAFYLLLGPGLMGMLYATEQGYVGAYLAVGSISLAGMLALMYAGPGRLAQRP